MEHKTKETTQPIAEKKGCLKGCLKFILGSFIVTIVIVALAALAGYLAWQKLGGTDLLVTKAIEQFQNTDEFKAFKNEIGFEGDLKPEHIECFKELFKSETFKDVQAGKTLTEKEQKQLITSCLK